MPSIHSNIRLHMTIIIFAFTIVVIWYIYFYFQLNQLHLCWKYSQQKAITLLEKTSA